MSAAENRRLTLALLISMVLHSLLLSLTFDGQGPGLPGFSFPWQARRVEAPELNIVLLPAPIPAAEPTESASAGAPQSLTEQAVASGAAQGLTVVPVPTLNATAEAIEPKAERSTEQRPRARPEVVAKSEPEPDTATAVAPALAPLHPEGSGDAAPTPIPRPEVIAMERSDEATWVVPPPSPEPWTDDMVVPNAPKVSTAMPLPQDASEGAQKRAEPVVRERAVEVAKLDSPEQKVQLQTDHLEAARIETARQEAMRQAALRQEAAQVEAARQEAARVEAARLDAERQEAARQAARQEAQRQEAARAEAARLNAERQEAARQAAVRQEAQRQEAARAEAARQDAERQEAARQAAARQEAQRQEAARIEAARLNAERQEAARQAAVRQEAQRQEAARAEAARLDAERQEAARQVAVRQEAQRQEAARIEAARLDAERQEAARQAAARQETARQEAARAEAARVQEEQEEDARRYARRLAMGRQLDEEAARRDAAAKAARSPSTLPYSISTARRGRLWGRSDPNAELVQYAEAWARKIQFNTPVDTVRELAQRPHTNPMVTVAIRSDGSVESVTFVLSSGVAEIDEAIRRIVQSHALYPAFPPGLAREYDVVEVRRTWQFDMAVRLY